MANNPYNNFDADEEARPLDAPAPIAEDRGEATTKGPRKKKTGKVLAVVALAVVALAAVVVFVVLFVKGVKKSDAEAAAAIEPDAALAQRSSTGPDLGAYQNRVAQQLEEDRKREERERLAREQAAKQSDQKGTTPPQNGQQGAPDLGRYQGQGQGGTAQTSRSGSGKKEELTPEQKAANRRWENDVMWDESNATGGTGQQRANGNSQGMDRYYSQATRQQQNGGSSSSNPSFEERVAANPYLNGSMGGVGGSSGGLGGSSGGGSSSSIGDMLTTEDMANGTAYVRPDLKFLLMHGTTISCGMLPRIVTNYPGSTRCLINRDVYSADGSIVLIPAGSVANGQRKVSMAQGVAKVFVAWRDIETKDGVSIRLDSMAADALGAAGIDAWIDNHYMERFGGAIMLSFLDDVFNAVADQAGNNNGVTFDSSTDNAQDMASIALENSINIPPTGYVNQGKETTIIVARDVDFRNTYGVE